MYINRALLLVFGASLIFYPSLETWLVGADSVWYRPFQLWLLVVVLVYWNQRSRYKNDL